MGFENWDFCERMEAFAIATRFIFRLEDGLSLREAINELKQEDEEVTDEAIGRALAILKLVVAIHDEVEAQQTEGTER